MSDTRLRSLERDTSPEGRARLLAERLRVGLLECDHCWLDESRLVAPRKAQRVIGPGGKIMDSCPSCAGLSGRERVELAAYCGDEAARVVLGGTEHVPFPGIIPGKWNCSLSEWTRGLSRWWQAVCVRAAVAAARVVHADLCRCLAGDAIRAADAWLACPCEEHRRAWYALSGPEGLPHWVPCAPPQGEHQLASLRASEVLDAARLTSEQAVREAVQRALIEWALP